MYTIWAWTWRRELGHNAFCVAHHLSLLFLCSCPPSPTRTELSTLYSMYIIISAEYYISLARPFRPSSAIIQGTLIRTDKQQIDSLKHLILIRWHSVSVICASNKQATWHQIGQQIFEPSTIIKYSIVGTHSVYTILSLAACWLCVIFVPATTAVVCHHHSRQCRHRHYCCCFQRFVFDSIVSAKCNAYSAVQTDGVWIYYAHSYGLHDDSLINTGVFCGVWPFACRLPPVFITQIGTNIITPFEYYWLAMTRTIAGARK